ncbi:hypothetical protein [Sphingomonas sp.]|uniref:hypothetical protein n=1 Tax=Sphingomonas sp. TaxID=28214 RepID=UPI0025F31CE3|nr:hypothetical protein [Sphingomonas sp.]
MLLALLALAQSSGPAFKSPEFYDRLMLSYRTEYPAVLAIIDAARTGNDSEFRRYVDHEAMISSPGMAAVPFTPATIRDQSTRCPPGNRIGTRIFETTDELSIYWRCPGGDQSPMTTLVFQNGKVIRAETGPAVVYTVGTPKDSR